MKRVSWLEYRKEMGASSICLSDALTLRAFLDVLGDWAR